MTSDCSQHVKAADRRLLLMLTDHEFHAINRNFDLKKKARECNEAGKRNSQ